MAIFLYFCEPDVEVKDNKIIIDLKTGPMLTDEMKELIDHGVTLDFELYISLIGNREVVASKLLGTQ